MPTLKTFFTNFGPLEAFFTVLIIVLVVGIREWGNIKRLLKNEKEDAKNTGQGK